MDTDALCKIGYGLYILTTRSNGRDNGCIVNTFSQLALSPLRVGVSICKDNLTCQMVQESKLFNITVLNEKARFDVFKHFGYQSGKSVDKFANLELPRCGNGLCYLTENANCYFSCKVTETVDLGSHILFIAEVNDMKVLNKESETVTYSFYQRNIKPAPEKVQKNGWRCKICNYVYEGETLPEDFVCPLCKHGVEDFEKIVPDPEPPKTVWQCTVCKYVYEGETLPENFTCPLCKRGAADFIKIEPFSMRFGSFLSDNSEEGNTVVLGHTLSLALFNTINSTVGKTITIMGEKFMIVGVLDEINSSINFDNVDFDNAAIIDIKSLDKIMGSTQIQQINVKATNTDSLPEISKEITDALRNQKLGDENYSVAYGDAITHPTSSLLTIVSGMLTAVAAISLVVGGIGVMNIMLVSVAERSHEIGVRKAVGASGRSILMQFLFEALILSILGGIFGLLLGYILAFLLSIITPFSPFISWEIILVTFLTTLLIGIVFGIYPALKAAAKDPIDSLKHYR